MTNGAHALYVNGAHALYVNGAHALYVNGAHALYVNGAHASHVNASFAANVLYMRINSQKLNVYIQSHKLHMNEIMNLFNITEKILEVVIVT